MEYSKFNEKYGHLRDEFNDQEYDERVRTSSLMRWEAIKELISSKDHLKSAIKKIDDRINTLAKSLDEDLKKRKP